MGREPCSGESGAAVYDYGEHRRETVWTEMNINVHVGNVFTGVGRSFLAISVQISSRWYPQIGLRPAAARLSTEAPSGFEHPGTVLNTTPIRSKRCRSLYIAAYGLQVRVPTIAPMSATFNEFWNAPFGLNSHIRAETVQCLPAVGSGPETSFTHASPTITRGTLPSRTHEWWDTRIGGDIPGGGRLSGRYTRAISERCNRHRGGHT